MSPAANRPAGDNRVLIAGGGIGGLATALALARRGIASHILERRESWSDAGAGIQLSPNAVKVLREIGVADALAPLAGVPRWLAVRHGRDGRVVQRLPLGQWIAERHGAPYWQAHRRDLQGVLVAEVERQALVTVSLAQGVNGFSETSSGVVVTTDEGATVSGMALIAADGVFSRLRQRLAPDLPPRYTTRTAARTVIDVSHLPDICCPAGHPVIDTGATGVWLAPNAHMVHYPVRGGRELAVVVVRTEPRAQQGWSMPVDNGRLEADLDSMAPLLARALGDGHTWRQWSLYEAGPFPRWSHGRVTLLGDAAHPTLPFMAQGGAMALEDAVVLAEELARDGAQGNVAAALAAYEARRQTRTAAVVAAARRNDRIFHLSGLAAAARNAAMRVLPGGRVMAGYDWIYGWQPPQGSPLRLTKPD